MRCIAALVTMVALGATVAACEPSSSVGTVPANTASAQDEVGSTELPDGPTCSELLSGGDVDGAAHLIVASINARDDSRVEDCLGDESLRFKISDDSPRPLASLEECALTDQLGYEATTCTAKTADSQKVIFGFSSGSAGEFLAAIEYKAKPEPVDLVEQDCVFYSGEGGMSGIAPAFCSDASPEQARRAANGVSDVIHVVDKVVPNSAGWGSDYCPHSLLELFDETSRTTYCLSSAPGYRR